MKLSNQNGSISIAVVLSVVFGLLFLGTSVFAFMTYASRQDYKNNSDKKSNDAVEVASKLLEAKKDADFAEKEKSPVKTYAGPDTFGTVAFEYPKTYSGYVSLNTSSSPLDGIFYPGIVPGNDLNVLYAIRIQVVSNTYDGIVKDFEPYAKSGKVTIKPFRADKVKSVLGVRVDGEIASKKQGSLIILPLRDKTLKIWTESTDFKADFDKYVVPSLSFIP